MFSTQVRGNAALTILFCAVSFSLMQGNNLVLGSVSSESLEMTACFGSTRSQVRILSPRLGFADSQIEKGPSRVPPDLLDLSYRSVSSAFGIRITQLVQRNWKASL